VGLTATPFRMDGGNIYGDGKLFNCLSYEIDYKTLMEQGFIVRCKAKEIDIMSDDDFRQLRTRMGEYSQNSIDRVYDSLKIKDIIKDVIDRTKDCKQVLVFSPNVLTCDVIKEHLNPLGGAEIVTGTTTKSVRMQLIDDFKQFKFKYLINVNCLTTGLNVTTIDCVAFIRPTQSPVLYAQTVSRGIRKAVGKDSVMLLDYGGNVHRHGTVDDLYIRDYATKKSNEEKSKKSGIHEPLEVKDSIEREYAGGITKICPDCKEIVRTHVAVCPDCGFDFVTDARRKEEEERLRQEEQERLEAERLQEIQEIQEHIRREMEHEQEEQFKREIKAKFLEVLHNSKATYCGEVLSLICSDYISYNSGLRSLQLLFKIRHNVSCTVQDQQFTKTVEADARLWLHFKDSGKDMSVFQLNRSLEWWTTLTGFSEHFPDSVDEALALRDLIKKPALASYQPMIHGNSISKILNCVCSVDYLGAPPTADMEKYYRYGADIIAESAKKLKTQAKQKIITAEEEYNKMVMLAERNYKKTLNTITEKYNNIAEQAEQEYGKAMSMKKELDEFWNSFYKDEL
jgi:hypothetical protein